MARTPTKINESILKKAFEEAEANGPLKNHNALFEAVCVIYNKKENIPCQITKGIVLGFANRTDLVLKTKKGRKALKKDLKLDEQHLIKCFLKAEKNGPLKNYSELFSTVTDLYNQNNEDKITQSIVAGFAKKQNIEFKTKKGKRGRKPKSVSDLGIKPSSETQSPLKAKPEAKKKSEAKKSKNLSPKLTEKSSYKAKKAPPRHTVITPSGKCPAQLTDFDFDSVTEWKEKVSYHYYKIGEHISLQGLKYFLLQFTERNSEDYNKAIEHLTKK